MRRAALQQAQLDAANLRAGGSLHVVGEEGGQTTQLGVTKGILRRIRRAVFGNELAVLVVHAFGNDDQTFLVLFVDRLDLLGERVQIKINLGQVDQIRAVAAVVRQRRSRGQPAGVTAHALHDRDHAGVIHGGILVHFHHGRRDVLRRRTVARAMVGAVQVVVDRLRNAHYAALVAVLQHILGDFVAGIHRVVAAVVEEIADVVLLEDLEDALIIGIVHIGILQLIAAGTQRGGRRILHQRKLCRIFLAHVDQIVIQNALDAVQRAEYLGDRIGLQRGLDRAVSGSVNGGGRTAGLTDNASATKLAHENHSFQI